MTALQNPGDIFSELIEVPFGSYLGEVDMDHAEDSMEE